MSLVIEDSSMVRETVLQGEVEAICRNLRLLPGKEVKDMIAPPCGMRPRCANGS
jgi:hypothetical protein